MYLMYDVRVSICYILSFNFSNRNFISGADGSGILQELVRISGRFSLSKVASFSHTKKSLRTYLIDRRLFDPPMFDLFLLLKFLQCNEFQHQIHTLYQ